MMERFYFHSLCPDQCPHESTREHVGCWFQRYWIMWQHDNRRQQEGSRPNMCVARHDKRSSFSLTRLFCRERGQAANYWMLTSIDPVSQKLFQSRHWYWYYPTLRRHEFNPKDLGNIPCGALGSDSSRKRHCCQAFQMVSTDALSTIVPSWHFSN